MRVFLTSCLFAGVLSFGSMRDECGHCGNEDQEVGVNCYATQADFDSVEDQFVDLENGNLGSGWIEDQAGMAVGSTCSDSAYIKYTYTCGELYPFIAFVVDGDLCEVYTEACCDNH